MSVVMLKHRVSRIKSEVNKNIVKVIQIINEYLAICDGKDFWNFNFSLLFDVPNVLLENLLEIF